MATAQVEEAPTGNSNRRSILASMKKVPTLSPSKKRSNDSTSSPAGEEVNGKTNGGGAAPSLDLPSLYSNGNGKNGNSLLASPISDDAASANPNGSMRTATPSRYGRKGSGSTTETQAYPSVNGRVPRKIKTSQSPGTTPLASPLGSPGASPLASPRRRAARSRSNGSLQFPPVGTKPEPKPVILDEEEEEGDHRQAASPEPIARQPTEAGARRGSMNKLLRRRTSNLSQTSGNGDDAASIQSRASSHRDAISTFIRRSRTRGSSAPPEGNQNGTTAADDAKSNGGRQGSFASLGRKRTTSSTNSSSRRMSLKLPGRLGGKKKSATPEEQPEDEAESAPKERSSTSRSLGRKTSTRSGPNGYPANGPVKDAEEEEVAEEEEAPQVFRSKSARRSKSTKKAAAVAAPAAAEDDGRSSPVPDFVEAEEADSDVEEEAPAARSAPAEKTNGTAKASSPSQESDKGSSSYLGALSGAVVGAGAMVGGAAAAIYGTVAGGSKPNTTGDGYVSDSDGDDDDDNFQDADLSHITEDEEEEHHDDQEEEEEAAPSVPKKGRKSSKGSNDQEKAAYTQAGRHRGVSEASGMDRRDSSKNKKSSNGPKQLKGTAGAKRRAGSDPVGEERGTPTGEEAPSGGTPQDAKAKKEVPASVRDKAARVAKLTLGDVDQDGDAMREDIETARGALHLFLNSRMIEAEEIIKEHADRRMYYALGYGLIATMKGFMTFEPEDLAVAISYCKDSMHISGLLRKQSNAVANFGRFVRGSGQSASSLAGMSEVQRHAELVYAESLLLKAVLGIVYSGDFFGFVAEALNMRTAYGSYRSLQKYVEQADGKASGGHDESIDQDFRSGVFLGNGLISLILGLLPGKVLKIMDVFGYSGDTKVGLDILMRAGGWSPSGKKPSISKKEEGIRRPVCDMGILLFHLVISVFIPVTGVDIAFADRILHYHLKRYPNGVFFLYFSGRLYSTQALCERAIKQYASARDAQEEYVQLKHISWWDASLCHMSLAQWSKAQECFEVLLKESNWSKCVYSYGVAANSAQAVYDDQDGDGDTSEASKLMAKVPGLMQRIAGKSIPMEKFVSRKAHKFNEQKRLLLPAIEFSYIYHCLSNAPRYALQEDQLVLISDALAELNEMIDNPSEYHSGADEFWDDFCLAHFLRGVTLKYIAHPEKHAKLDPEESDIPQEEAEEQAMLSFKTVLDNGHKITTDHYLIYFSHLEIGRLQLAMGEINEGKKELDLVLSGKLLEDKDTRRSKHKYGMQNMCLLRANGALNSLKQEGK